MKRIRKTIASLVLFVIAAAMPLRANAADASPVLLTIKIENEKPVTLSAEDFQKNLPRQTIHVKEKGADVTYEGVLARDVLAKAGIKLGDKQMRGEKLLQYVIAEAADGYNVVFSLAELAPDFGDKVYLIADLREKQPLAENEGKLRWVIPAEEFHARWIRQLTTLEICKAPVTQKPHDKNVSH